MTCFKRCKMIQSNNMFKLVSAYVYTVAVIAAAIGLQGQAMAQEPPEQNVPQTTTVTTPQGVTVNITIGAPVAAPQEPQPPAEPPPPPGRERGGFSHISIGPGFVFIDPATEPSETFGGLSLASVSGIRLLPFAEIGIGMSFVLYDFERMGDAYAWLFEKDSIQIVGSPFLMFLLPLWFSQITLEGQATFYISQIAPSFFFGVGGGFSNVLIDGSPCPGYGFSGTVGYEFLDSLGVQYKTIWTDSFSSEGGSSVSGTLSLVLSVDD